MPDSCALVRLRQDLRLADNPALRAAAEGGRVVCANVRRFVPELARLPDSHIHRPWEAPPAMLEQAGIQLGRTYPRPVVGLREGRERALAAFARIRSVSRSAVTS